MSISADSFAQDSNTLGQVDGQLTCTTGFNFTVQDGKANNARIEKRIYVNDACVWHVSRWIDPLSAGAYKQQAGQGYPAGVLQADRSQLLSGPELACKEGGPAAWRRATEW